MWIRDSAQKPVNLFHANRFMPTCAHLANFRASGELPCGHVGWDKFVEYLEIIMDGTSQSSPAPGDEQRVNGAQLQRLVQLLDNSDVSEIEVKRADVGMHLVLRKAQMEAADYPAMAVPAAAA